MEIIKSKEQVFVFNHFGVKYIIDKKSKIKKVRDEKSKITQD